jgi:hypothetical protein
MSQMTAGPPEDRVRVDHVERSERSPWWWLLPLIGLALVGLLFWSMMGTDNYSSGAVPTSAAVTSPAGTTGGAGTGAGAGTTGGSTTSGASTSGTTGTGATGGTTGGATGATTGGTTYGGGTATKP